MERQYTREQIVKAIKHWSNSLQRMDEDESNAHSREVVDALIEEFGADVVKSQQLTYRLNDEDLKKIFDILNKHLFGGKLPKV